MSQRGKHLYAAARICTLLKRYWRSYLPAMLPGGEMKGEHYCVEGFLGGKGDNLRVHTRYGYWKDDVTGVCGFDMLSLYAEVNNMSQRDACKALASLKAPIEARIVEYYRWDKLSTHFRWKTAKEICIECGVEPTRMNCVLAGRLLRRLNGNKTKRSMSKVRVLVPKRVPIEQRKQDVF